MKNLRTFLYRLKDGVDPRKATWMDQSLVGEVAPSKKQWYRLIQMSDEDFYIKGLDLKATYLIQSEDEFRKIVKSEFIKVNAYELNSSKNELKLHSRESSIVLKGK